MESADLECPNHHRRTALSLSHSISGLGRCSGSTSGVMNSVAAPPTAAAEPWRREHDVVYIQPSEPTRKLLLVSPLMNKRFSSSISTLQ